MLNQQPFWGNYRVGFVSACAKEWDSILTTEFAKKSNANYSYCPAHPTLMVKGRGFKCVCGF